MICAIISNGEEIDSRCINENEYNYSVRRTALRMQIDALVDVGYNEFYINCMCGIPIWAGHYLSFLKLIKPITMHLILPCENMTDGWSESTKDKFSIICESADSIDYVGKEFDPDCYTKSENMMMDASDLVLLCGSPMDLKHRADYANKNKKQFCFFCH